MEEKNKSTSYGNIFKTTFLFGFVQLFKAFINIAKNKLAAILIGPEGLGILGIYQNVVVMLQTCAGLGVNQSAVRDISKARGEGNPSKISVIISVVNRVILLLALFGCTLTIGLSYWLSDWTFGDHAHVIVYCIVSVVVALNIVDETKQAILKGMRQLKALAHAGIIGSSVGLIVSIPLYYFFEIDGIVPSLLIASIIAVCVSNYFVKKINQKTIDLKFQEVKKTASPMIKMGISLMIVTLLQYSVSLVIISFIRLKGGLADVGFYNAGNVVINGYFGMVITALMTDYYPRIAAVNNNDSALQEELNKQSLVSLVLTCPMFVIFMTLLPLFIKLLYTSDFLPAVNFVKWSIYFTLITIVSNQIDMILVAKFKSKIMILISLIIRFLQVILSVGLYTKFGIEGLGISYLILGIVHFCIMSCVVYHMYKIRLTNSFFKTASIVLLFALASSFIQSFLSGFYYYIMATNLILVSLLFSLLVSKKMLGLDFINILYNKLNNYK